MLVCNLDEEAQPHENYDTKVNMSVAWVASILLVSGCQVSLFVELFYFIFNLPQILFIGSEWDSSQSPISQGGVLIGTPGEYANLHIYIEKLTWCLG